MAHNDAISMAHSFLLNFQKIIFRHWNSRKIRIKRRSTINNRTTPFWRQISSKLFKKSLKFLTKTDTPESLKCNLLLLRYILGLAFLWDMISLVFTLHWLHRLSFSMHHHEELYLKQEQCYCLISKIWLNWKYLKIFFTVICRTTDR